jgi:hypothetical protein
LLPLLGTQALSNGQELFAGRRGGVRWQQAAWPKAGASSTHSKVALATTKQPCQIPRVRFMIRAILFPRR